MHDMHIFLETETATTWVGRGGGVGRKLWVECPRTNYHVTFSPIALAPKLVEINAFLYIPHLHVD